VPSGVRPNPNAVSRALMLGLVGIVFATLVTVITNDVLEKLVTVNLAVAKRVASASIPGRSPSCSASGIGQRTSDRELTARPCSSIEPIWKR
jgi:hypothetical protein